MNDLESMVRMMQLAASVGFPQQKDATDGAEAIKNYIWNEAMKPDVHLKVADKIENELEIMELAEETTGDRFSVVVVGDVGELATMVATEILTAVLGAKGASNDQH